MELHLGLPEQPGALPAVAREIHRLLRGARAFDRHRRLGEQCTAAAKTAHQTVGIGRKIVSIVGRYAVRAERSGEPWDRSEEHTFELQSLMRISYAVFCLKNTTKKQQ